MGILDILATGYLAGRANNKLNPPIVTAPDGVQVVGMKAKGIKEYQIRYKKKGSSVTEQMTINRNTRSRSGGWEFHWS